MQRGNGKRQWKEVIKKGKAVERSSEKRVGRGNGWKDVTGVKLIMDLVMERGNGMESRN